MRGEKVKGFVNSFKAIGSSPHARGKVCGRCESHESCRIIPARAGKRVCRVTIKNCSQDHPRMRGEKGFESPPPGLGSGSSPHARGKASALKLDSCSIRIIPACAGKSAGLSSQNLHSQDHPRMCGEKQVSRFIHINDKGSSPHVRGKVFRSFPDRVSFRIIPACAGKRLAGAGTASVG